MTTTPASYAPLMVDITDMTIAYNEGTFTAVDRLTLKVPAGQVLGLLGGNGAGKTSTMKAVAGVLPITSGKLSVAGYNVAHIDDADTARSVLGYCPDTGGLIRQATVREHIGIALALRSNLDAWPYALTLVERFGLTAVLDVPAAGFSHGMSRRLSVVLAALTAQKVLILDEPFDGVDPTGVTATQQLIADAKNAGLAVIVSTHLLSLLSTVSDRIVVMVKGHLADDAPADAFRGDAGTARYAKLLATA